jgi:hypothetical protein
MTAIRKNRREDSGSPQTPTAALLRRSVAAVAACAALMLTVSSVPLAAAPETSDGGTAAAWGAAWLEGQLESGIPLASFGSPDWGTTVEGGLALAAVEGFGTAAASVWNAVLANREAVVTSGGQDVPGRLALVILLAVALGEDPSAVGAGADADLVSRLQATRQTTGADAGLYGTQDPTYDGAYRQGYALTALAASGATADPTAVDWLVSQQCDDGSWMPYRSDLTAACALDLSSYVGPDTNSTGAALSGLIASGLTGLAVDEGLDWLDDSQEPDGGWAFFPGSGSDPNSTSVVIQALLAAGLLDSPDFGDRSASPLEALLEFQLGCDEGADAGAFTYPGSNNAPNSFASVQAVQAAAGAALGFEGPVSSGSADGLCAPPTTTTTSTSTPATTAPSTSTPVATPIGAGPSTSEVVAAPVADATASADSAGASSLAATGGTPFGPASVGAVMLLSGLLILAIRRRECD